MKIWHGLLAIVLAALIAAGIAYYMSTRINDNAGLYQIHGNLL